MNFQGDPRIFFEDENGGDIEYQDGQPVMDTALYNAFNISLYTDSDYWANPIIEDASAKLGSDYEELTRLPITLENIKRMEGGAEAALEWLKAESVASEIKADVRNPSADRIEPIITITEPSGVSSKYSTNWADFEEVA